MQCPHFWVHRGLVVGVTTSVTRPGDTAEGGELFETEALWIEGDLKIKGEESLENKAKTRRNSECCSNASRTDRNGTVATSA